VLSAKAKRRQEKGLDRAEAVMDKKEKKVQRSKGKARTVQERAKAWDDLNKVMGLKKLAREQAMEVALEQAEEVSTKKAQEDVEINDAPNVEELAENVPLSDPVEDEEEIL